ncbi:MAG TPA: tetraacyldisaccharide 4'-kinase [Bryobacterales bacterium]|nr:tetraacyldisaccharide 4'-kinase [Bryobacterales bacterium]
MFFLYNLLLALASPFLVPYYLFRGLRKGKSFGSFRERLGRLDPSFEQTRNQAIWLHAVSVGEVLSCEELLRALRRRLPDAKIFVSTTTATGRKIAREKLRDAAAGVFYAPIDAPFAVRRALRRLRPRLVIIAETEIWPNLYRETKRSGASLLVVNARISDRSAPRYRRFRFFFRHVLALPDAILAQSPLDRERLIEAGGAPETVEAGGNLKFDLRAAEAPPPAEILALLERSKPRVVLLAGSTREGEEAFALRAFRHVSQQYPEALLVLAPRHSERFDAVAKALAASGFAFVRRSQLSAQAAVRLPGILLLDSLGELASLYPLAHAVFIGGSLVDWGGHNVLEPALAARPIVVGPHMQNFRAIADTLLAAQAMVQVPGPEALGPALLRLLDHPEEARALGERARRVAEANRGSTERAAERAEQLYHRATPDQVLGALEGLLLWLPARLWESVARHRSPAYASGRRARRKLGAFTISVGNLTAGGTGKTPVVLWLLEQLAARGLACAVLTRGYRRASPEKRTILEPGAAANVAQTGDEAQILLRRFRLPLGIARDRGATGEEIERRFQPDVILLDDGFQHQQLARDLDIVLIDVTAPLGGRELLPLGRLREPLPALARADALLLTRAEPWEQWDGLVNELRRYNSRAPILFARIEPAALVEAATGVERPLTSLAGEPAVAFCGVANPDAFWHALESIGAPIAERIRYRDHHRYSARDLRHLEAVARRSGAAALVTTEKDLVNLPGPLPSLYWLKTRVVIPEAERLLGLLPSRSAPRAREGALR